MGHDHQHVCTDPDTCFCVCVSHLCAGACLLQRRYMDNVPAIVPLLEREHRVAESRLDASRKELDDLASDKLKVGRHTGLAALLLSDPPGHACVGAACLVLLRPHDHPSNADES